jgi:hypothetical protein
MQSDATSSQMVLVESSSKAYLRVLVYIFVALFGLGTWTNLAGVSIQSPLMVSSLPESWLLPAKLGLIVNSASIFPLMFVFASLLFKFNTAPFEVSINFVLLSNSIVFAICFALFWNKTVDVFGSEQSLCLMCVCFFTAMSDCTSSATFIPFLHRYEPVYLNAYFIGEALTSLLPALLGVVQGIGVSECLPLSNNPINGSLADIHYEPRFSVRTYFFILSSLPLSALVAFMMLRLMRTGRLQQSKQTTSKHHKQTRVFILMENIHDRSIIEQTIESINNIEDQLKYEAKLHRPSMTSELRRFALSERGVFLFIVFQCSAILYGACQGLTTFSLNAYSVNTFHYTIILSNAYSFHERASKKIFVCFQGQFSYPIMALCGIFISEVPSKAIYLLYGITVGLFSYILTTVGDASFCVYSLVSFDNKHKSNAFSQAKMSPCPPLVNETIGHVIIVKIRKDCSCPIFYVR